MKIYEKVVIVSNQFMLMWMRL